MSVSGSASRSADSGSVNMCMVSSRSLNESLGGQNHAQVMAVVDDPPPTLIL